MGYYKSDNLTWEEGDIPECSYCGVQAINAEISETLINNTLVCDKTGCLINFAYDCIVSAAEFIEDDK